MSPIDSLSRHPQDQPEDLYAVSYDRKQAAATPAAPSQSQPRPAAPTNAKDEVFDVLKVGKVR
jgi:hypothetical protein